MRHYLARLKGSQTGASFQPSASASRKRGSIAVPTGSLMLKTSLNKRMLVCSHKMSPTKLVVSSIGLKSDFRPQLKASFVMCYVLAINQPSSSSESWVIIAMSLISWVNLVSISLHLSRASNKM